jgi:hypothetical protein
MRKVMCACALGLLWVAAARPAGAQQRDTTQRDSTLDRDELPREVAREVTDLFNGPTALRAFGRLEIAEERRVEGDVAVLNGPLVIAGHVTGRVVAVNADVILRSTARIDGELLVVGGALEGKDVGFVGGDIRVYRQALPYHQDGDRIIADRGNADEDDRVWERWRRRHRRSSSKLTLASASTYNRVEGLPIYLGPQLRQQTSFGSFSLDALGVFRTADDFRWDSENVGHRLRAEVRLGRDAGIALGGRAYDIVEGVETWHLTDTEVGLASFFLHRDYRDYFNRHGVSGYAKLFAGEASDLTVSYGNEWWASRRDRDPWTITRNSQTWRPNPQMDDGRFHVGNATLRIDTRNDEKDPWAGWFVTADYEIGSGRQISVGPTSTGVRQMEPVVDYQRVLLDLRRYNRLSPEGQLNMRVVLGGWIAGDELPLQRRFSVGGPGTLPGYDFRRPKGGDDVFQCGGVGAPPGHPAQCERIALAQAEYRGDLHFELFDWEEDDGRHWGVSSDATWIVFADAGRGWLVGPEQGELVYPRDAFPALGTFRTDVGIGFEAGVLGLYIAKSVTDSREPANFFVRVRHRF